MWATDRIPAGSALLLAAALAAAVLAAAAGGRWAFGAAAAGAAGPAPSWKETKDSLALLSGGKTVWGLDYARGKGGKPAFETLALPGGANLVWFRPPDHPWHRGLWFSWTGINGVNYWEEDPKTGVSPGATDLKAVRAVTAKDGSAGVEMTISYHPPDQPAVLMERRIIRVSAARPDGQYHIDWTAQFTAGADDVELKGGVHGGGYAGLSARLAEATRNWEVLNSEGLTGTRAHGQRARWVTYSGLLGGGRAAGIAILDHPANVRHPSPWYVAADPKVPFNYFGPAPLFAEPYRLPAGRGMTLRYRVIVYPARADAAALEKEWKAFCGR